MKQTVVKFLVNHLTEYGFNLKLHKIEIKQAKEMEKQQIIDAISEANKSNNRNVSLNSEQYYNEQFNK